MEDTVLCKEPTGVLLNSLDPDRVSNVTSLSAFLATLNQSSNSSSRIKRFLDETGSLDVNVGDNSSCRLSDISSVSYTNITQDDNESLGCETNASLENVIDSASSCRSDEESPYELDQDDVDYDLDSNGYFGSSKYLVKHPSKVDKSSMTNLALSEDDIKNFMGSVAEAQIDSNSSLYDEMKVGKSRLVLKNSLLLDANENDHINDSEKLNNEPNFQVQNGDDSNSLDLSLRSPGFRHCGSVDSNIELKEIFHEKEYSNLNKMELKLNGIVGPKAAICNSKGSKVTLEFYCGKGAGNDRIENSIRVRNVMKVHRNEDNMPGDQNKIDSCEKSEAPIDLSQPMKSIIGSTLKGQEDVKKLRMSSKLRPSPGLAKRIGEPENWSADDLASKKGTLSDMPELALNGKSPESIEENCASKTVVSGETCEPKPAERKKNGGIKALDFCNEDIESSLNEIRSILYGSRVGLANGQVNAQEMNINPNYEVINYSKLKTTSCSDICTSDSILKISNDQNKIVRSCSLYEPSKDQKFVSVSEKSPQNICSFEFNNDNKDEDIKLKTDLRRVEKETKLEMSVIDELLEELRMNEPSYNEESTNHNMSSPDVEIKSEFKIIKTSKETAPYNDTLTVPYVLEKKTFSLSPEVTDCDSIDASSIISEEEKTSPSAMPVVEDGLSSDEEVGDKDLREEGGRGNKNNKEIFYNHLRSDQSARVPNKHDDKLLPLPASGSTFGPTSLTSHPKQNGVSIRTKNLDRVARRDLKPKIKASPTDSTTIFNETLKMVDLVDSKCNDKPDVNDITKSDFSVMSFDGHFFF